MLLFWPLVIPFATAILCMLAWRSRPAQRALSLAYRTYYVLGTTEMDDMRVAEPIEERR